MSKTGLSVKYPNYFIHPDTKVLMFRKEHIDSTITFHIVVPHSLKSKTLAIAHLSHFGLKKTYEFLTQKYFWKGIYNDTLNFVISCPKCLVVKHHKLPKAPLQKTYTPRYPGHTIAIDLVGPFSNGFSVLTATDHFSRHMELFPLKDTSTHKIVNCLFKYFTTFGRPSVILSDLGPQFNSYIYDMFHDTLGIKISHSSSFHPQCNSIAERINASIKSSVNILMLEGHSFEIALAIHKSLYNGSCHSSTKFSPNLLHFGRELPLIFDTYDHNLNKPFLDTNVNTYQFLKDLDNIYQKAYDNITIAQQQRNTKFSTHAKLRKLEVNDIVYLKSADKFKPKYTGPYEIVIKHSPVSFSIRKQSMPHLQPFRIHIDRLIKAFPRKSYLNFDSSLPHQNNFPRYNLRSRIN